MEVRICIWHIAFGAAERISIKETENIYARKTNIGGELTYWQYGISACAVPIFKIKILAVVGGKVLLLAASLNVICIL